MSRRRKPLMSLTGQSPPRHPLQHVPLTPPAREALVACIGPAAPPEVGNGARSLILRLAPLPLKTQAQILEAFVHAAPTRVVATLDAWLRMGNDNRHRFGELAAVAAGCAANLPLLEALLAETEQCLLAPDKVRGHPLLSHLARLSQEPANHSAVQEVASLCLRPTREDRSPPSEGVPGWAAAVLSGLALHAPGEVGRLWAGFAGPQGRVKTAGDSTLSRGTSSEAPLPSPSRPLLEHAIAGLGNGPAPVLQALTGLPYAAWAGGPAEAPGGLELLGRVLAAELPTPALLTCGGEGPLLVVALKEAQLQLFGWTEGARAERVVPTSSLLQEARWSMLVPEVVLEHHRAGKALPQLGKQPDPALRWFLT